MSSINPDLKDEDGRTAFHLACIENHNDKVELLLIKGANINDKDNLGSNGLHLGNLKQIFIILNFSEFLEFYSHFEWKQRNSRITDK
jgi:ankyrin repeat protein